MSNSNPPSGYSWLGVSVPGYTQVKTKGLTKEEEKRLDSDCEYLESKLLSFENKIHRYNSLCKKYKKAAKDSHGMGLLHQMEILKKEIEELSTNINKTLDDTVEITHSRTRKKDHL